MISHETLEKYLSLSPRGKIISILIFIIIILVIVLTIFKYGESVGKTRVNQKIQQELEDSQIREAGIRADAEKLAGQNDLLKAQNEAQADLLIEAETKRNKENAEKLKQIFDDHQEKLDEIQSETDVKNSIRNLCAEAKATGYNLSEKFCSQSN